MKKLTLCTALVVISLILAACSTPVYTSDTGKFSIAISGGFTEKTQTMDTGAGKIDQHQFITSIGKITYMVTYQDYPPDVVAKSSSRLLDIVESDDVTNVSGILLNAKQITLGNYSGYEALIESRDSNDQQMTTKVHIYLVGNRVYQVLAIANTGDADFTNAIDPYLNSFKV